jgi:hypothetical protein
VHSGWSFAHRNSSVALPDGSTKKMSREKKMQQCALRRDRERAIQICIADLLGTESLSDKTKRACEPIAPEVRRL